MPVRLAAPSVSKCIQEHTSLCAPFRWGTDSSDRRAWHGAEGGVLGDWSDREHAELRPGAGSIPLFRSSMGDRMPPPFKMHMDTWFQDISSGCLRLLLICNSSMNIHSLFWVLLLRISSWNLVSCTGQIKLLLSCSCVPRAFSSVIHQNCIREANLRYCGQSQVRL